MPLIDRILTTLRASSGTGRISPRQASARFKVPQHSVRARVSELRAMGYDISNRPLATTARRSAYTLGASF